MTKEELRNEKEKIVSAAFNSVWGTNEQKEYWSKELKKAIQASKLSQEEIKKACEIGKTNNFNKINGYLNN